LARLIDAWRTLDDAARARIMAIVAGIAADNYRLNSNVTLDASGDNGLLSNDTDPEG